MLLCCYANLTDFKNDSRKKIEKPFQFAVSNTFTSAVQRKSDGAREVIPVPGCNQPERELKVEF